MAYVSTCEICMQCSRRLLKHHTFTREAREAGLFHAVYEILSAHAPIFRSNQSNLERARPVPPLSIDACTLPEYTFKSTKIMWYQPSTIFAIFVALAAVLLSISHLIAKPLCSTERCMLTSVHAMIDGHEHPVHILAQLSRVEVISIRTQPASPLPMLPMPKLAWSESSCWKAPKHRLLTQRYTSVPSFVHVHDPRNLQQRNGPPVRGKLSRTVCMSAYNVAHPVRMCFQCQRKNVSTHGRVPSA